MDGLKRLPFFAKAAIWLASIALVASVLDLLVEGGRPSLASLEVIAAIWLVGCVAYYGTRLVGRTWATLTARQPMPGEPPQQLAAEQFFDGAGRESPKHSAGSRPSPG
jgi:hypothetical protein